MSNLYVFVKEFILRNYRGGFLVVCVFYFCRVCVWGGCMFGLTCVLNLHYKISQEKLEFQSFTQSPQSSLRSLTKISVGPLPGVLLAHPLPSVL